MTSEVESRLDRILANETLKRVGIGILILAAVVWAAAMLIQVNQNASLTEKNEDLVTIVHDLEIQNEELDSRLQCRANFRDELDRALARGLAAVAQEDNEELQRQANIILLILEREEC